MLRWIRRLAFIGALIALVLTLHLGSPWELVLGRQVIAGIMGYLVGRYIRSRPHPYLYGILPLVLVLWLSFWSSADLGLATRLALMLATGYGYAAGLVLEYIGWRRRFQRRPTRPLETCEEGAT